MEGKRKEQGKAGKKEEKLINSCWAVMAQVFNLNNRESEADVFL